MLTDMPLGVSRVLDLNRLYMYPDAGYTKVGTRLLFLMSLVQKETQQYSVRISRNLTS